MYLIQSVTRKFVRDRIYFVIALIAYVSVLAWVWPSAIAFRGDDFGYMDELVRVLRDGFGARGDWLEPYNRVLPYVSGIVWGVTGSAYAGTFGLQFAMACGAGVLFVIWAYCARGNTMSGALVALGVLVSPVWLHKATEYTGTSLSVVILLGALIAWDRGTRWLFFVLLFLGILHRQSAVCLLAIPLVSEMGPFRVISRRGGFRARVLLLACVIGVMLVVWLQPDNLARSLSKQGYLHLNAGQFARSIVTGTIFAGSFAAFWSICRGETEIAEWPRRRLVGMLVWLGMGVIVTIYGGGVVRYETTLLALNGDVVLVAAVVLAALSPVALFKVRKEALAFVIAYIALVAIRGTWWDYYLIEPFLVLAWWRKVPEFRSTKVGGAVLGCGLLLIGFMGALVVRQQVKWAWHSSFAYETLVRRGDMSIGAASGAPFGYLGWKLFPLAVSLNDRSGGLSGFLRYVEAGRSSFLLSGIVFYEVVDGGKSLHPTQGLHEVPDWYEPPIFPLDDVEWNELIDQEGK